MAMSRDELEAAAEAYCRLQAREVIRGEFDVEATRSEETTDAATGRREFRESLDLWKTFSEIVVITAPGDRIVGYVDRDKYSGLVPTQATPAELLAIAATEPLVPLDATVVDIGKSLDPRAPDAHRVLFALPAAEPTHTHLEVEINAARRAIIAVRPATLAQRDAPRGSWWPRG